MVHSAASAAIPLPKQCATRPHPSSEHKLSSSASRVGFVSRAYSWPLFLPNPLLRIRRGQIHRHVHRARRRIRLLACMNRPRRKPLPFLAHAHHAIEPAQRSIIIQLPEFTTREAKEFLVDTHRRRSRTHRHRRSLKPSAACSTSQKPEWMPYDAVEVNEAFERECSSPGAESEYETKVTKPHSHVSGRSPASPTPPSSSAGTMPSSRPERRRPLHPHHGQRSPPQAIRHQALRPPRPRHRSASFLAPSFVALIDHSRPNLCTPSKTKAATQNRRPPRPFSTPYSPTAYSLSS